MKQFALIILLSTLMFTNTLSVSTNLTTCYLDSYIESCNIEEAKEFNYNNYASKMSYLESRGSYTALNRFGYMGRYQFGKSTLKGLKTLGHLKISNRDIQTKYFLSNPANQELAMEALTRHNLKVLGRYNLMVYAGKYVGGVRITVSGMLAAAHLVGPYAVKKFIKSNGVINEADGNGTTAKKYMKEFA